MRSQMTTLITKNSGNRISENTVKLFLNRKTIKFGESDCKQHLERVLERERKMIF